MSVFDESRHILYYRFFIVNDPAELVDSHTLNQPQNPIRWGYNACMKHSDELLLECSMQSVKKDLKSEFIRSSKELKRKAHSNRDKFSLRSDGFVRILINIAAEKCEGFFSYLRKLGLSDRQNLVVLSSLNSFDCDRNKLDEVKTVVNRRKLNLISHLDMFLFTLVRILPGNTSFIGCFSESKESVVNTFGSFKPLRLLNSIIGRLDTSSEHVLNKDEVSEMLAKNGLTLIDMTEMNGLTYFCSRKICNAIELSA